MIAKHCTRGDTLVVDLWYPKRDADHISTTAIEVGLACVRAADSLKLRYDFERDGWVVYQASKFRWGVEEKTDPDWQEVAFIQAWAREERHGKA